MFPLKSLIRGVNALQVTKLWQNTGSVQCAFMATKKTIHEEAGLPPKPKRPLTPYFRFMQQVRPQFVAQNPDKHILDVVRMIAKSWEKVDEATKRQLESEYKKDKEVFDKELLKYESKLTPQQKEDLKNVRHDRAERRARLTIKKRNTDLGKPKRATTAFLRFLEEERKKGTAQANESLPMYVKRMSEKWKKLSDAEKKPYVEAAAKGLAQYKLDIENWEKKMIKEGNFDVIRNPLILETTTTTTSKKATTSPTPTTKATRSRKSSE